MNTKRNRFRDRAILGFTTNHTVHGFTLVELVITMGIVALLFVTLVPLLHAYDMRNRVKYAAEAYQAMLVEARNYSMAPRAMDTNPTAYSVKLELSGSDLKAIEKGYINSGGFQLIEKRNLPTGIAIDSACPFDGTAQYRVDFFIPNANTKFENIYDRNNKIDNIAACTPVAGGQWKGDTYGNGHIKLKESNKACSATAPCQKISINADSGQVILKAVTP